MDNQMMKGFAEELNKTAGASLLLGTALGGAALGYGGYKKYQEHKQNQMKKKMLRARQAHENRLGRFAPRMDPRSF